MYAILNIFLFECPDDSYIMNCTEVLNADQTRHICAVLIHVIRNFDWVFQRIDNICDEGCWLRLVWRENLERDRLA